MALGLFEDALQSLCDVGALLTHERPRVRLPAEDVDAEEELDLPPSARDNGQAGSLWRDPGTQVSKVHFPPLEGPRGKVCSLLKVLSEVAVRLVENRFFKLSLDGALLPPHGPGDVGGGGEGGRLAQVFPVFFHRQSSAAGPPVEMKPRSELEDVLFTELFVLKGLLAQAGEGRFGVRFVLKERQVLQYDLEEPGCGSYYVGVSFLDLPKKLPASAVGIVCPASSKLDAGAPNPGLLDFPSGLDEKAFWRCPQGSEQMRKLLRGLRVNTEFYLSGLDGDFLITPRGFEAEGCRLGIVLVRCGRR